MQIDYTDLAACVNVDYHDGRIDPEFYLDCGDDYEKMNYKRFCLALEIDEDFLKDKTAEQYKEIFIEECKARFQCDAVDNPLCMAVILSSLFAYTKQGINGNYFISHDSRKEKNA